MVINCCSNVAMKFTRVGQISEFLSPETILASRLTSKWSHQIDTNNESNDPPPPLYKTITFQTKAMTTSPTMNFTLPTDGFMTQTRPMMTKKMTNLLKIQMTKAWIVVLQKTMKTQNQWLKRLTKML
jgi:hypothetical protein